MSADSGTSPAATPSTAGAGRPSAVSVLLGSTRARKRAPIRRASRNELRRRLRAAVKRDQVGDCQRHQHAVHRPQHQRSVSERDAHSARGSGA